MVFWCRGSILSVIGWLFGDKRCFSLGCIQLLEVFMLGGIWLSGILVVLYGGFPGGACFRLQFGSKRWFLTGDDVWLQGMFIVLNLMCL